jgi:hypothetical protein
MIMHKSLIIAAVAAFAIGTAGISTGFAKGQGGGHGSSQSANFSGLDRADASAGTHGAQGRAIARQHGANRLGFCPPGQAKKSGNGSRFQC